MTINHDGHIHKGKDFPVKDNRAQRGYRNFVKPGSRAELDSDMAAEMLPFSNHAEDDHFAAMQSIGLSITLAAAQDAGSESKARKAKRQLNKATEARLHIRASWCPSCVNFLHNCSCPATAEARGASAASLDLIRRIQQDIEARDNDYREAVDDLRRQRKAERKQLRKAQQRLARDNS
jgi:hypothetical protein